jgi:virulence factor
VIIAVSIDQLFKVASQVIDMNINVFIEKPVAENLAQVLELKKISDRRGIIVFPGFIMRFDPTITYLYESTTGKSHSLENIYAYRLSRRPENMKRYSIIYDLAIHDIDIVNMLTNTQCEPLKTVYGEIDSLTDQYFITYLKCQETTAYIHTDGYSSLKIRKTIAVSKDQVIEADSVLKQVFIRPSNSTHIITVSVGNSEPLIKELEAFIKIIRGDHIPNAPTIDDAIKAHMVIESALKMIKNNSLASQSVDR